MAEYRLAVQIGVEPDKKWVSRPNDRPVFWVPQYLKASGTYVEVESVGELLFDAEGQQQQANENHGFINDARTGPGVRTPGGRCGSERVWAVDPSRVGATYRPSCDGRREPGLSPLGGRRVSGPRSAMRVGRAGRSRQGCIGRRVRHGGVRQGAMGGCHTLPIRGGRQGQSESPAPPAASLAPLLKAPACSRTLTWAERVLRGARCVRRGTA